MQKLKVLSTRKYSSMRKITIESVPGGISETGLFNAAVNAVNRLSKVGDIIVFVGVYGAVDHDGDRTGLHYKLKIEIKEPISGIYYAEKIVLEFKLSGDQTIDTLTYEIVTRVREFIFNKATYHSRLASAYEALKVVG